MMGHYVGDVTGSITADRTYVTIPESDRQTVVLTCGDRSVEVSWRDLFEMLSCAVSVWNRRASDRTTTRNGKYRTKYGRRVPLCECCGYSIGDLRWKFCPSCGAEVVDHD